MTCPPDLLAILLGLMTGTLIMSLVTLYVERRRDVNEMRRNIEARGYKILRTDGKVWTVEPMAKG